MTRAAMIVAAARAALDTPFKHQGRRVGVALDCAGLGIHCVTAAGLPVYDETDYPRTPGGGRMEAAFDRQPALVRVPVSTIAHGDIVLMRMDGEPQHVAIIADGAHGLNITHAFEKTGRVVEHILTPAWRRLIVRAYRAKEFDE